MNKLRLEGFLAALTLMKEKMTVVNGSVSRSGSVPLCRGATSCNEKCLTCLCSSHVEAWIVELTSSYTKSLKVEEKAPVSSPSAADAHNSASSPGSSLPSGNPDPSESSIVRTDSVDLSKSP